jgi:uncharacterized protein YjiS (DUF1127 family)
MSCGSTICDSTNNLEAASPSFQDLKWSWNTPLAWLAGIALRWERRYQYRQLLELDDHLLADIGLSRTTVEEVRRSPLYLIAWRDSR